jgi:trigger factor
LKIDLAVEVKPEIEARDYEGLPVRRRKVEVSDQDVDDFVERLRESRAVHEKVDRPAEIGDQILLDLEPDSEMDGSEGRHVIENERFELGAPSNMEAFNAELVGVSAGDERTVTVEYPAEHPNEKLRGRSITFTCRIKEVAAKTLPEVDDAFAANLAPGKTLLELRTDIRQDLQKEIERRVAAELDQQLAAELAKRNDVPLPPSMVEKYLERGVEEMHRRNAQSGAPADPEQDREYREAGRPHAEKALSVMLLLEAVRRQEDIKVEDSDVDERIGEIAREHGYEVDAFREFMKSGDERDHLEYDLLERRTYDFLLSRAEIEDVPADTDVLAEKE